MLQNPCKTLRFKKNMVYKIPLGGGKPYPASGLKQIKPSFLEKMSRSSKSNFGVRFFDRTRVISSDLILQICLSWIGLVEDTPYTRYVHMATDLVRE